MTSQEVYRPTLSWVIMRGTIWTAVGWASGFFLILVITALFWFLETVPMNALAPMGVVTSFPALLAGRFIARREAKTGGYRRLQSGGIALVSGAPVLIALLIAMNRMGVSGDAGWMIGIGYWVAGVVGALSISQRRDEVKSIDRE